MRAAGLASIEKWDLVRKGTMPNRDGIADFEVEENGIKVSQRKEDKAPPTVYIAR